MNATVPLPDPTMAIVTRAQLVIDVLALRPLDVVSLAKSIDAVEEISDRNAAKILDAAKWALHDFRDDLIERARVETELRIRQAIDERDAQWRALNERRVVWRCFHCAASFTAQELRAARAHFGETSAASPACLQGDVQRSLEATS